MAFPGCCSSGGKEEQEETPGSVLCVHVPMWDGEGLAEPVCAKADCLL